MIKTKKEIMDYVENEIGESAKIPGMSRELFSELMKSTCMSAILEVLIDIRDTLISIRRG